MKSSIAWFFQRWNAMLPVVVLMLLFAGCIPSAPEPKPARAPAPAEVQAAPVATDTAAKPSVPAEPASTVATGQPHASLNIDPSAAPNASVTVESLKDGAGFSVRGTFNLEGMIVPNGAGKWKFSGQFSMAETDFAVGVPAAATMGTFSPTGVGMSMDASVVMITLPVRPPASKAAEGSAPRTIPFSLDFDAPEKAQFTVCLTQM